MKKSVGGLEDKLTELSYKVDQQTKFLHFQFSLSSAQAAFLTQKVLFHLVCTSRKVHQNIVPHPYFLNIIVCFWQKSDEVDHHISAFSNIFYIVLL